MPPNDKPAGLADRAVEAVGGVFKRLLFHGAALVISALVATDAGIGPFSHSLAYFLCNYVGILYLFPAGAGFASFLPTALGLGLGGLWLALGYPFFMLPFWAGAYCFVQSSLNGKDVSKISFLSAGWLVLCGFVNFYFSALLPSLWPAVALLPAGFALDAVWKKRMSAREDEMNAIRSGNHVFGDAAPEDDAAKDKKSGWDPQPPGARQTPSGWDPQPPVQGGNRPAPGEAPSTSGGSRYHMGWNTTDAKDQPTPQPGAQQGAQAAARPAHWREFDAQMEQLTTRGAGLDPDIRDAIARIGKHTRDIMRCMAEDTRDVAAGERFLSRYLPAAINVVESCAKIPVDMPEADSIAKSTLDVLQRLESAFKSIHISMAENDKMDAKADLAVLDKLLKMQGH